jgi:hypothetical protein
MREIDVTEYCLDYIDKQGKRVSESSNTKAVCLNGFIKKSNKDYLNAIKEAKRILEEYLKNREL